MTDTHQTTDAKAAETAENTTTADQTPDQNTPTPLAPLRLAAASPKSNAFKIVNKAVTSVLELMERNLAHAKEKVAENAKKFDRIEEALAQPKKLSAAAREEADLIAQDFFGGPASLKGLRMVEFLMTQRYSLARKSRGEHLIHLRMELRHAATCTHHPAAERVRTAATGLLNLQMFAAAIAMDVCLNPRALKGWENELELIKHVITSLRDEWTDPDEADPTDADLEAEHHSGRVF